MKEILSAIRTVRQFLSNFPADLNLTKTFEQLIDNLNATMNHSKDAKLRELLGS
jgi:hypothetical protein